MITLVSARLFFFEGGLKNYNINKSGSNRYHLITPCIEKTLIYNEQSLSGFKKHTVSGVSM